MSMQESTDPPTKVLSLFDKHRQPAQDKAAANTPSEQGEESFSDVMRRNAETQERLRKERNKANQAVLRSYRIKN